MVRRGNAELTYLIYVFKMSEAHRTSIYERYTSFNLLMDKERYIRMQFHELQKKLQRKSWK